MARSMALVHEPVAHELPALLDRDAGGTAGLAGREVFAVFPTPARNGANSPVTMSGMGPRSVSTRSPIRPPRPSSASQTCWRNSLMGRRFLPTFSWGPRAMINCQSSRTHRASKSSGRPMASRKRLRIVGQPGVGVVVDGHELGVGQGEPLVGAPEEDAPAHHADAWPVAQDVVRVLGLEAADHGRAAGHELGEVVAHRPEHEHLPGRRAWGSAWSWSCRGRRCCRRP